jgi:L-fuculose-phosphate aldolase/L-ribulose-5-phosphate 4-epimerase
MIDSDKMRGLKECVLESTLSAYRQGLFAGTSGNLSMCDESRTVLAITPSSFPYEKMTLGDIMVISLNDGAVLDGPHRPSSEWRMHAAILRARSDARAVVHTHSPYATGFAVTSTPIPLILIEMLYYIGGDVPVADFGMPGSDSLGDIVAASLAKRNACLMRNHGVVAIGSDLDEGLLRAVYVEDAAKIFHHALAVEASGRGEIELVPPGAVEEIRRKLGLPC